MFTKSTESSESSELSELSEFTELEIVRMKIANKISSVLGEMYTVHDVIMVSEMPLYQNLTREHKKIVGKLIPSICFTNKREHKRRLYYKYIKVNDKWENLTIFYILEILDFVIINYCPII